MKPATDCTEPLSSMSLPNRAPSRKIGKNWAKKPAAPPMKVSVQCASKGSPANSGRDQGGDRRQQQHAPAAVGEPD